MPGVVCGPSCPRGVRHATGATPHKPHPSLPSLAQKSTPLACPPLQAIRRPLHFALVDEADSLLIGENQLELLFFCSLRPAVCNPQYGCACMLTDLSPALYASLTDEAINPFIITGPLGDSRSQGARWAEAVAVSARLLRVG